MQTTEKYDVVIIGGGLGGLVCANIVALDGKKVCILEKEPKPGGNLQTFKRNGCLFDTGMHYIGSYEKGQPLYQIFKYLDLVDKFRVQRLNDDGYDVISIGNHEFKLRAGYENFTAVLKEYFPGEDHAIDTFVTTIKSITERVNNLNIFMSEAEREAYFLNYNQSAFDFINSLTQNKLLKAVLAGNNGLYCGNSQKTPLILLANTNNFYLRGAWRMTGGGHELVSALVSNIRSLGGVLLTRKKVVKLGFRDKNVAFAETIDGERFEADHFISNAHPALSLGWIEQGRFSKVYSDRLRNLENTIGAFVLYLVVEKGKIRHRNGNLYFSADENVWDINRNPEKAWPHGYMLYTTQEGDTGFAQSITAVTMMDFDLVKKWENTAVGRRGAEYEEFKKQKMQALLTLIQKKLPELEGRVKTMYAATPLTFRDYTGTVNGSMYGIERDCRNPYKTFVSAKTRIPNFYFTGQNINNHGMLGVSIGALITASYLTDIQPVIEKIKNA